MYFLTTTCESFTGKLLYSDEFCLKPFDTPHNYCIPSQNHQIHFHYPAGGIFAPCLNRGADSPIYGMLFGIFRIILSIFHMLGHVFAYIITEEIGHLYHCVKGSAECLRGMFETIPVIGNLFLKRFQSHLSAMPQTALAIVSVFIIKIYNPNKPDIIDAILYNQENSGHPLQVNDLYI